MALSYENECPKNYSREAGLNESRSTHDRESAPTSVGAGLSTIRYIVVDRLIIYRSPPKDICRNCNKSGLKLRERMSKKLLPHMRGRRNAT